MREYFMKTKRLGFSKWNEQDTELANLLWGEKDVTKFICASGEFSRQDIIDRLNKEIQNDKLFNIQYWPIFELETNELVGCCGIRPFDKENNTYELGFHLRKKYWGMGYAYEGAKAVIEYSFNVLKANKLFAGHHPDNDASRKLVFKLGFDFIGKNFYEPTGLYHPSYELSNNRNSLSKIILIKEYELLKSEVRKSAERISQLLCDNFIEFTSSGNIAFYDVGEVFQDKDDNTELNWEIKDFRIKELEQDCILATYKVIKHDTKDESKKYTLRSSIWKCFDGNWKMVFHQGTITGRF